MSKLYRETFQGKKPTKEQLRKFHQRPGRIDEKGNIQYTTEQHHKNECDVNNIIKKYDKHGIITHVSEIEARFGDFTGHEFQAMQQKVTDGKNMFNLLPAETRKEFDNDIGKLLAFMENEENRDRAIELGLINPQWTEETDGLGEHVKLGENVIKDEHTKGQTQAPAPTGTDKA